MQLTVNMPEDVYNEMSMLLGAGHGLSVEEYLEGHLQAYWHMLNSKREGREQFCDLEMAAHYIYHEMSGDIIIAEEEFP